MAGAPETALVERLVEDATRDGADLALLFRTANPSSPLPDGFEVVPTIGRRADGNGIVATRRADDARPRRRGSRSRRHRGHGAGPRRPVPVPHRSERRSHQTRDHRKRLLAGLGAAGVRQMEFVIAEEGITAAAYIVISVVGGTWTIEECGDRDASGARVGALLQALIAREPAESRPVIRGWLPPGFLPPQVTIASSSATPPLLLARALRRASRTCT